MTVRWLRHILTATALLAATACSTAEYGKPINDFAAATAEAETVLAELNTQLVEGYGAVLENNILSGRGLVEAKAGDCLAVGSTRCRLEIFTRDGERRFYPPEPPLAPMALLMAQINKYAANLKALVEADTAKQVEGQVNAALGSVQNLAETVVKAGGEASPPVPQFATPVGSAVNWVVGHYVDSVKYKGLQDATAAAKSPVRNAAKLFGVTSGFASRIARADLAADATRATTTFDGDKSKASLAALVQTAAKYDAFLTAGPQQMFQDMAAAHDALADSLQNQELSFGAAVGRIETFAAEAKKLAKIVKDLRAVVPAKPGG
jgi:class 3 adenylate cyclase